MVEFYETTIIIFLRIFMQKKSYTSSSEISLIISGEHSNPSQIIGQHKINIEGKEAIIIRGFFSFARDVWIIHNSEKVTKMKKVHKEGFYEAAFPGCNEYFPYHFRIKDYDEKYYEFKDPYSFPPILSDYDLYLLTEGTHNQSYEKMGAHYIEIEGIYGVHFAVWAPNAKRVSVLGDFNRWDGRIHPMNNRGTSGIWELFIPDLKEGETYKYEIKSKYDNQIYIKSDPYAFYCERPPKSASIVHNIDKYVWNDQQWIEKKRTTN